MITQGLFLGSVRVVQNMEALKELNITHILTVAHFLTLAHPNDFTYKTIVGRTLVSNFNLVTIDIAVLKNKSDCRNWKTGEFCILLSIHLCWNP